MKKKSRFSTKGQQADIGDLVIYRILANRCTDAVGPFVFSDHIFPKIQTTINKEHTGAHLHRGIATLTDILHGEDESILIVLENMPWYIPMVCNR